MWRPPLPLVLLLLLHQLLLRQQPTAPPTLLFLPMPLPSRPARRVAARPLPLPQRSNRPMRQPLKLR